MRTCFRNLLCKVKVNHEVLVLVIDPLISSFLFEKPKKGSER